ncbi:MAG: NAD(P)/FAD-dependent oxidoreductase [Elusimicrobia bacterium]|nr:NAD(P)/FAD-dependent oxidoreductase [Candidatus Liberimonas magnetica]
MTIEKEYDLIVIGGGPAGYSAAIRASQLGLSKVLLIEEEKLGGTCLNRGCVPTKFIWEALNLAKRIKNSNSFGIISNMEKIDLLKVIEKKNRTVELLSKGIEKLLESYSIGIVEGKANFAGPKEIEIEISSQGKIKTKANRIIIATGSLPKTIPTLAIDHKKVLDSTDILNLKETPKSMLVVGGGAIGIELATILSGFGCEVELVEKEKQLLPGEDMELVEEVKKILQRNGIKVNVGVESLSEYINKAKQVLVAIGRKPNIEPLNLDAAKINYNSRAIEINTHFETSQKGVYACGDVAGLAFYAYTAQAEGVIAVENALGKGIQSTNPIVPRVVFSNPVVASVGNVAASDAVAIGRFPISANSKAFILGERQGWIKITAQKGTGLILSGHIVGPDAENLITIIAFAIKNKMTVNDLVRESFFHPSVAETIHGACEDLLNQSVDLPRKKQ